MNEPTVSERSACIRLVATKFVLQILLATILFVLSNVTASGVTISDGDFSNWVPFQFVTDDPFTAGAPPNISTGSGQRLPTGGNPGALFQFSHTLTSGDTSWVGAIKNDFSYDTRVGGAISNVSITADVKTVSGNVVAWQLVVEQAGRRYYSVPWRDFRSSTFRTVTATNLTAADFDTNPWAAYRGSGVPRDGNRPNFSETAPSLRFGFMIGNRLLGPGTLWINAGLDNYGLTIVSIAPLTASKTQPAAQVVATQSQSNEGENTFQTTSEPSSNGQSSISKLPNLRSNAPQSQLKPRREMNPYELRQRALDRTWKVVFGVSVIVILLLLVPMLPFKGLRIFRVQTNKDQSQNPAMEKSRSSATTNKGDAGSLASHIFSKVESLARPLNAGELSIRPVAEQILSMQLIVESNAVFLSEVSGGKGRLPSHVEAIDSVASMDRILQQRLEDAEQEAGGRLDGWAKSAAEDYCKQLTPEWCMSRTSTVGVQSICGTCRGEKRIVCSRCNGSRRVMCSGCGGRGKVNCFVCHGQGSVEKTEYETVYTSTGNQQRRIVRRVPCSSCFAGLINCMSGCGGTGRITCPTCGVDGKVPCENCAASGYVHRTSWISCAVSRREQIKVTSNNPEDQETFQKRVPFNYVDQLASNTGGIIHENWGRDRFKVTNHFKASVQMECAEAKVAGKNLVIRAYGPQRQIYNYHNLVGTLLEADLASLEKCVRPFSVFMPSQRSSLVKTTNRFLASEVNVLIVENLESQTKKGQSKNQPPTLGSRRVTEMVSQEYISRAGVTLGKAMPQLYSRIILPMWFRVTAVTTLLFLFGRKNVYVPGAMGTKIMVLMVLAGLLWFGVERLAQRRLKLVLDPQLYTRLNKQFSKRRIWYRLIMVGGFLFAWYASLIIARWVLYIGNGTPMDFGPNDSGWFWQQ